MSSMRDAIDAPKRGVNSLRRPIHSCWNRTRLSLAPASCRSSALGIALIGLPGTGRSCELVKPRSLMKSMLKISGAPTRCTESNRRCSLQGEVNTKAPPRRVWACRISRHSGRFRNENDRDASGSRPRHEHQLRRLALQSGRAGRGLRAVQPTLDQSTRALPNPRPRCQVGELSQADQSGGSSGDQTRCP